MRRWPEEREQLLKRLWIHEGLSITQIMKRMGMKSRGAISAKIRVMGWTGRIEHNGQQTTLQANAAFSPAGDEAAPTSIRNYSLALRPRP